MPPQQPTGHAGPQTRRAPTLQPTLIQQQQDSVQDHSSATPGQSRSETQGHSTEPTEATMQLYLTEGGALLQTPRASQKFNVNLITLFRQLGSPRPLRSTRRSGAPPKRGAGRCWLQRRGCTRERELVYALHLTLDAGKGVPIPKKSKASSKTKLLGQNPGHRCIKKGQTPRSRRAHILASASD